MWFRLTLSLFVSILLCLPVTQAWAAPRTVTGNCGASVTQQIDFSSAGEGVFQTDFFRKQGLIFTQGDFVGFVQGDEALVGPIAGSFHPSVCSLSLRVAPALQGTAAYTLTAFSPSGEIVSQVTVTVTQDSGDPENGPFGYFTIELANLTPRANYFTLENRFIRSSFPQNTQIPFAISSLTYTAPRGGP
jgi:hypothetical protein